jgi:multiple sugar transport system permease protein
VADTPEIGTVRAPRTWGLIPGRARNPRRTLKRPRARWAFVAPTILLLLGMTAYPFAYAVYISLHTWKTTFPTKPYVGIDNYRALVTDDDRFVNAIVKTLVIAASSLTIEFVFGLAMAILFWTAYQRIRWVATFILVPMMIAPVVVGFTARMAFTDSFGFVNQILSFVLPGHVNAQWLSDPNLAPIVIIAADAWQWGPFVFLLLLAGLLATTGDEIEAAVVDGANARRVFWHIVLPAMRYILIVAVVLRGLDLLRMFDVVALATRGGPGTTTETLSYYIYNLAFKFFDLGYAAAASMLMLVGVSFLVMLAVRSLVRRQAA